MIESHHLPSSGWTRIVTLSLKVWHDDVVLQRGGCPGEVAKKKNKNSHNEIWDVGVWEGVKKGRVNKGEDSWTENEQ